MRGVLSLPSFANEEAGCPSALAILSVSPSNPPLLFTALLCDREAEPCRQHSTASLWADFGSLQRSKGGKRRGHQIPASSCFAPWAIAPGRGPSRSSHSQGSAAALPSASRPVLPVLVCFLSPVLTSIVAILLVSSFESIKGKLHSCQDLNWWIQQKSCRPEIQTHSIQ